MDKQISFEPFYANINQDEQGDYEVHRWGCPVFPKETDHLGVFLTCEEAVQAAKTKGYATANGCIHCNPTCHTS